MDGDIVAIVIGSLAFYGLWVGAMILGAATQRWWGPKVSRIASFLFDR